MARPPKQEYQIYTDGSCRWYRQRDRMHGGWAFIVLSDPDGNESNVYRSGFCPAPQTNNSMELMAVLEALRYVKEFGLRQNPITILSDSQYVIGGMVSQFRHQVADGTIDDAPNSEIWKLLHQHAEKCRRLSFRHVKGHSTNVWNNYCDAMAGKARTDGEKNHGKRTTTRAHCARRSTT
jgi:ribonuclease HI